MNGLCYVQGVSSVLSEMFVLGVGCGVDELRSVRRRNGKRSDCRLESSWSGGCKVGAPVEEPESLFGFRKGSSGNVVDGTTGRRGEGR